MDPGSRQEDLKGAALLLSEKVPIEGSLHDILHDILHSGGTN